MQKTTTLMALVGTVVVLPGLGQAQTFDPVAGTYSPVTCAGTPNWPAGGVTVATPTGLIVFNGTLAPDESGLLEL